MARKSLVGNIAVFVALLGLWGQCLPVAWAADGTSAAQSAAAVAPPEPSSERLTRQFSDAKLGQICQETLQAYGGEAALRALLNGPLSYDIKLKVRSSKTGEAAEVACSLLTHGKDKFWLKIKGAEREIAVGFDGTTVWAKVGAHVLSNDEQASKVLVKQASQKHGELTNEFIPGMLLDLLDEKVELSLLPDQTVNGQSCHCIQLQLKPGKTDRLLISKTSHLVMRIESEEMDAGTKKLKRHNEDIVEYRPIGASVYPHLINGSDPSSPNLIIEQIAQMSIADLPDSAFARPEDFQMAGLTGTTTIIPFEFKHGRILVKATANDSQPLLFQVDTGCTFSGLNAKIASTLGKPDSFTTTHHTLGGVVKGEAVTIPSLSLGDVTLKNFPIDTIETLDTMAADRVDGLLGADFLSKFVATFDYDHKRLILYSPDSFMLPSGGTVVPAKLAGPKEGPLMFVDMNLDGRLSAPFLVDTGAFGTTAPYSVVKSLLPEPLMIVGSIVGLDKNKLGSAAVQFHSGQMGDLTLINPVLTVYMEPKEKLTDDMQKEKRARYDQQAIKAELTAAQLEEQNWMMRARFHAGNLGERFFEQYRVTLDYRNKRLILEQNDSVRAMQAALEELKAIEQEMHRDKDWAQTMARCDRLNSSSDARTHADVGVVASSRTGLLKAEHGLRTGDSKELAAGHAMMMSALTRSRTCERPLAKAKSIAHLLKFYAETKQQGTKAAQLLAREATRLPMVEDPDVCIGLAEFIADKASTAESVVDVALLMDPSNWDGLWLKYDMAKQQKDGAKQSLVRAQLRRYYADAPAVEALP